MSFGRKTARRVKGSLTRTISNGLHARPACIYTTCVRIAGSPFHPRIEFGERQALYGSSFFFAGISSFDKARSLGKDPDRRATEARSHCLPDVREGSLLVNDAWNHVKSPCTLLCALPSLFTGMTPSIFDSIWKTAPFLAHSGPAWHFSITIFATDTTTLHTNAPHAEARADRTWEERGLACIQRCACV